VEAIGVHDFMTADGSAEGLQLPHVRPFDVQTRLTFGQAGDSFVGAR